MREAASIGGRTVGHVCQWALALLVACFVSSAAVAETHLRVMTFNIRFDFPSDGPNRWRARAERVAETIETIGPQLVGLQEDKCDQVADLERLLPRFRFIGRGRNASGRGERCSILYDPRALTLEEHGSFWLSDTPEVAGSNTWRDKYPRVVTWGRWCTKGGGVLLALNLHLPEGKRRKRLRERGLEVVRRWLLERLTRMSKRRKRAVLRKLGFLVLGDFNEDAEAPLMKTLTGEGRLRLRDAWREVSPRAGWPGTYNGFKGLRTRSRIDWILVGGALAVRACGKFEEQVLGGWPSDHYPVWADLVLAGAARGR